MLVRGHADLEDAEAGPDDGHGAGAEVPDTNGDSYDYAADEADGDYDLGDRGKSSTTTTTTTTTSTTTTTTTTVRTYSGDVEDVDEHIRRRKAEAGAGEEADICRERFDSLAVIRGELFVFLGRRMWRFSSRGVLRPGYPAPGTQMFGFPPQISREVTRSRILVL